MGGSGWARRLCVGLFGGPQGFQEAEGHIAMGGVLPSHERHLLAEDREVQGPVDEEQHATAFAGPREIAEQQPGGKGEPEEGLHPLDAHDDALQPEAGARPLGEQALVLAANSPLRGMGPHRHQPEERVEIEAAQGAHMAADAEVPCLEEGLGQQRHAHGQRGAQPGERRARRIEPGDPDRRQDELAGGAQELSAEVWQEPQRMGGMAALGHVRGESALEIAIAEARDDVAAFYAQPIESLPPPIGDTILVVQADGKGVPMVLPSPPTPPVRLAKGQKRTKKKEAVVTGLYTIAPYPRTPQVVAALLQDPNRAGRPNARGRTASSAWRSAMEQSMQDTHVMRSQAINFFIGEVDAMGPQEIRPQSVCLS